MEVTRVFDILDKLQTYPKPDILSAKVNKQWQRYSTSDFLNHVNWVSSALLHYGLNSGDKVALLAGNSPQWNFVDFGSQQVNITTAPIFPTINDEDLKYILNHCEARMIFVSDRAGALKIQKLKPELKHLEQVVSFGSHENCISFEDFLEKGKSYLDADRIRSIKDSIKPGDLFTLLYTSGTTGQPKGVMLSHYNMLSNVKICENIAPFTPEWKALSFLPLNHVYERFLSTLYLYKHVSIYYAENFETIGENCREIHPQLFVAVPRILEKVLEKICAKGEELKGVKRKIFDWSLQLAERFELKGANGAWYEVQRKIADKLVYKKWREAVGGEIVIIVSGGAALNPRIERIFYCAGLNLLQGYGLTETCVVVAVNRIEEHRRMFGTVGLVVENSVVKIAEEDGEILVKGPSVMMGYYKNQEATTEVIDAEGWFHTGDVGTMVEGRFLKITDRKKEIFKNSAGKYISPVLIENKLKESKFIEQCMVIGENQKFVSAFIVPSLSAFKEYCKTRQINWSNDADMMHHEELKKIIQEHVKKVNSGLAPFEQVKRQQLVFETWTIEKGEITPKLSLRRKIILQKHHDLFHKIFLHEE
ncbi:MAG TPA: long-chain fatty acid--CoA ligase [Bacteroidia bacterium]|nr:long-chain fatty acid--CoA ligase [Bacteroidia bacterium]